MRLVRVNPTCPVCKSKRTGRYLYGSPDVYQIKRHFVNGERVEYTRDFHKKSYYCLSCNANFTGKCRYTVMSRREFKKYLAEYGFIKTRNDIRKNLEATEKKKFDKKKFFKGLRLVITLISGVDVRDKTKEEQ